MITDVGLDLDGVMFDFSSVAVDHFSRILKRPLTAPTTWEFYREPAWNLTKEGFYTLLEDATINYEIFDQGSPIAGTRQGWDMLRAMDIRIHIITHRSRHAMNQTTRWLERHDMLPDSLHFTDNKAGVLDAVTHDKAVAIDDHYEQCRNYSLYNITSFLYHQPWNKGFPVRRVFALPDFVRYIELHNQYWKLEDELRLSEETF